MQHKNDSYPMLEVEEAVERFLSHFRVLEPETVPLMEALHRVLAQPVSAPMDIPPLANTAMDGYAARQADTEGVTRDRPRRLKVAANLAAGYVIEETLQPGAAVRIMTGAPVPPGADTVIPFEDTQPDGDGILIFKTYKPQENIRSAGEDVRAGAVVLEAGKLLRPQEIGMLAALGYAEVAVYRRPRVGILSTGDEVIDISDPWQPGKIRDANGYTNAAQVLKYGGVPLRLGIARDHLDDLTARIRKGLEQKVDLFMTSGGVSVGDFDVVKDALVAEGEITFWRVRMKPGKPLAFGLIQGVPLLGLPGNPVSAMVSFELFARPAILLMQGKKRLRKPIIEATLAHDIQTKGDRRHYVRLRLERTENGYLASLTGEQGSGILRSMVLADGLGIIPAGVTNVRAGDTIQVMMLDWNEVE